MPGASELISGTCQQLLFSPKGGVEGALLHVKGKPVQISFKPELGTDIARTAAVGKRWRVWAVADHSPKTREGVHPVYQFESLADSSGNALELPDADPDNTRVKGVVAALHFARHGQPNGVVLKTGEFIHLRPHGMAEAGLKVGSRLDATGKLRMTILGTRMLEAQQVNGLEIA